MKNTFIALMLTILLFSTSFTVYSQKLTGSVSTITASDLKSYVSFLASPLLRGRENGEPELGLAAAYIASEAKLNGLQPANDTSFFQQYMITRKIIDSSLTNFTVISDSKDTIRIKKPFFQIVPTGPDDFIAEGEVVFAGYGIKSEKYKYNDFSDIKTEGKIILVMTRAPTSGNGEKYLFEGTQWSSFISYQFKLSSLLFTRAKAVLIVTDPKSGFSSFDEEFPLYAREFNSVKSLKGEKSNAFGFPGMPKIIAIHRSVADELLKGSGHTLEELQNKIDSTLQPQSFTITGKKLNITEVSKQEDIKLNNVAGYLEGSDPVLKNEFVVFSAHYDHLGASKDMVFTGADDDASGCAALLSLAKAFHSLNKKPSRSLLFLWVSGEEIGLYGSKSYVDNPLFPLAKTVADLNIDMIGREKGLADSTSEYPMTGPSSVFVITDSQSSELRFIADDIDNKSPLDFDYSLSGRNHPLQLFARSDHYNFVKKDIPVLCFSSGLHTDYHTPGDVTEKLDFSKMELVSKTIYDIGLVIANKKTRLIVDNPFSSWSK